MLKKWRVITQTKWSEKAQDQSKKTEKDLIAGSKVTENDILTNYTDMGKVEKLKEVSLEMSKSFWLFLHLQSTSIALICLTISLREGFKKELVEFLTKHLTPPLSGEKN